MLGWFDGSRSSEPAGDHRVLRRVEPLLKLRNQGELVYEDGNKGGYHTTVNMMIKYKKRVSYHKIKQDRLLVGIALLLRVISIKDMI